MSTSGRLYAQASFGAQVTGPLRNWINGSVNQSTVNPWEAWTEGEAQAAVDWGVDGILIHNPFGTRTSDNLYSFDQFMRAKTEVPNIVEDFNSAWDQFREDNPLTTLVAYIGSAFENEHKKNRGSKRYYLDCVEPFLKLGMGIGFDDCVEVSRNDYLYQMALSFTRRGLSAFAEGRPKTDYPHWANFGCVSTVSNWNQAEAGGFDAVPSDQIHGGIIIIADTDFASPSAQIAKIKEAYDLHPTAKITIPVWWLMDQNVTLEDVEAGL